MLKDCEMGEICHCEENEAACGAHELCFPSESGIGATGEQGSTFYWPGLCLHLLNGYQCSTQFSLLHKIVQTCTNK